MHIRNFDLDRDYENIVDLWHHAGPGVHVGPSDSRAALALKLTRDPDLFLVLEDDGQLVGSVIGGFDGRRGLVYHLAVAETHRGRGGGALLMNELERRLRAKGCRKCYLLIAEGNEDVFGFYQHLGWSEMPVTLLAKTLTDENELHK